MITITVPPMKDFEVSLRKQEKRKKSLTEYISCFRAPSIPSIVCISEDLIGPIPGDPEQLWYTQLWKAIFGACSRDNRLVLMTYLSDPQQDSLPFQLLLLVFSAEEENV